MVGVAAAIGIAVAAPYLAPFVVSAAASIGVTVSVAVATALVGLTLSVGLSLAFMALGVGVPKAMQQSGPPSIFRQSFSNSFIVYGKRRVGGLIVFFHGKQGTTGAHWRYFVIAVAGHRCHQLVNFMLNDEIVTVDGTGLVTSGKYANNAWLWFQRGLASETANATFVSECDGKWTTAHKGNGVAAIYAKFKLTDDLVSAGMPNITAIIEGKDDILDPRTATTGYTNNGALVFYDWLKVPREEGGFGAYDDEIPDDAWISAQANVCDETVDSEARYALDAVITTGAPPGEVRDAMIVNMAGTYAYSGGKHLMRPGYYVLPNTDPLSEDDLAAGIQVSPFLPADTMANEVQGTFIDPSTNYQGAPFTTQQLSPAPADVRQTDLDLAFITSLHRANRVARIMLNRAQYEKTVVWPMNIAGLGVKALDNVQLDSTRYSLSNYVWAVSNWALSADWGVVLSLREENADIYADPTPVTTTAPPTITKPSPVQTLDAIRLALQQVYLVGNVDAIDAGTNATIRIYGATTADNFTMEYPTSSIGADSEAPVNITGLAYSTLYYPYCDVDPATLLPTTWGATTVYLDSLNSATNPYRVTLARQVTTPAAGGGTTSGGTTGGGYGGGGTSGDGGHVASV